jgi:hypothetical protein
MTNEVDEMSAHRHGTPLFSQRSAMAAAAVEWCDSANAAVCPVNIVTALFSLGLVVKPTLTDEEREAIEWAWCSVGRDDAFHQRDEQRIRDTLLVLLERTR